MTHPFLARPEALFPRPWFQVAVAPVESDTSDLHPAERALLPYAVPLRLAAFAAGRRCARRALRQLDAAAGRPTARRMPPILRDAQGSPLWPAHATGSISHDPSMAIAVVAERTHVHAVGVDVETLDRDVGIEVLARIFTPAERQWLAQQPAAQRQPLAFALFSAREALYKCVYQACGHRLGATQVELQLDVAQGLFRAEWRCLDARVQPALPPLLFGRFGFDPVRVFAGVWCVPAAMNLFPTRLEPAHETVRC